MKIDIKGLDMELVEGKRVKSGNGRYFLIVPPEDYKGKKHIGNRYVYEHRYVMEKKIGRLLESNEVVHHIDGNKLNNSEENLELTDKIKHGKYHAAKPNMVEVECAGCGKKFWRRERSINSKKWSGLQNNFCDNKCQAVYKRKNGTAYTDEKIKEIKEYHYICKSYKKTAEHFNISSRGTLHFLLKK